MMTLLYILLAVFAVIVAAIVVVRVSSKPKLPQDSQASQDQEEKTDWGKEWEKWKEKIAIPLSVIAFGVIWWLNEPDSFSKAAHSRMFWSGAFLVVVLWGYFLTLPKTFKESFSRKIFMLTAFPVGIVMMFFSFVPVEKVKLEIFSVDIRSSGQEVVTLNLSETNWSELVTIGSSKFRVHSEGWREYMLVPSGDRIKVDETKRTYIYTKKGGTAKRLSKFPPRFQTGDWAFRLRGDPGLAQVTILD